jgi:hypothetical protein
MDAYTYINAGFSLTTGKDGFGNKMYHRTYRIPHFILNGFQFVSSTALLPLTSDAYGTPTNLIALYTGKEACA